MFESRGVPAPSRTLQLSTWQPKPHAGTLQGPLQRCTVDPASQAARERVSGLCPCAHLQVVQFPGFSMDELTSLSLPIRAMACSPDGKHLCMAGDEQGARMCKFIDGQVSAGRSEPAKLTYDPATACSAAPVEPTSIGRASSKVCL